MDKPRTRVMRSFKIMAEKTVPKKIDFSRSRA